MRSNSLLGVLAAVALMSLGTLSGCGGAEVETSHTTATTGQQLMDLQKAYEAGIITQQEYEQQRKKLLDQ
jgi:hypothetical protein